jgi:phage baseplate assembly protein W
MNQYSYPYNVDGRGRTASVAEDLHIRQMIEQVLFTSPGERVNRPTFGSGINQILFAPNSTELAAATQFLVQGSLQQWLGDLIHVEDVKITNEDSSLVVIVRYVVKSSQQRNTMEFTKEV